MKKVYFVNHNIRCSYGEQTIVSGPFEDRARAELTLANAAKNVDYRGGKIVERIWEDADQDNNG